MLFFHIQSWIHVWSKGIEASGWRILAAGMLKSLKIVQLKKLFKVRHANFVGKSIVFLASVVYLTKGKQNVDCVFV